MGKNAPKDLVILGIDPGTTTMGYGLISVKGGHLSLIQMGVLDLSKYSDHAIKLQKIFQKCLHLIDGYNPDELAIEAPFYGKNIQSMLKLGRAQGVAIAAALYRDIPMTEYSPRKIKQSITGKGSASKEQVAGMLTSILGLKELPDKLDATDGTAVSVCHYFQSHGSGNGNSGKKKYKDWGSFLKDNPGKEL